MTFLRAFDDDASAEERADARDVELEAIACGSKSGIIAPMTRRRLLLIASLPLAIAVVLCILAMLPARRDITIAKYQQIKEGMAKSEVEQILGRPCDQVVTRELGKYETWSFWDEVQDTDLFFRINVRFVDLRVHHTFLDNSIPAKTTFPERILRLLDLD